MVKIPKSLLFGAAALAALFASTAWLDAAGRTGQPGPQQDKAQYVGAAKCKMCHKKADMGDIYGKWAATKHAKAYQALATDAAKEAAKAKGIDDPQKAPECLKCHATGAAADPKKVSKSLKQEMGVQCESCHGPGSLHIRSRMKTAKDFKGQEHPWAIPAGEMHLPTEETCRGCHNPESPSYKEFKLDEFLPKVRHFHPNRPGPRWLTEKEKKAQAGG